MEETIRQKVWRQWEDYGAAAMAQAPEASLSWVGSRKAANSVLAAILLA
jgi:hypothetical protein